MGRKSTTCSGDSRCVAVAIPRGFDAAFRHCESVLHELRAAHAREVGTLCTSGRFGNGGVADVAVTGQTGETDCAAVCRPLSDGQGADNRPFEQNTPSKPTFFPSLRGETANCDAACGDVPCDASDAQWTDDGHRLQGECHANIEEYGVLRWEQTSGDSKQPAMLAAEDLVSETQVTPAGKVSFTTGDFTAAEDCDNRDTFSGNSDDISECREGKAEDEWRLRTVWRNFPSTDSMDMRKTKTSSRLRKFRTSNDGLHAPGADDARGGGLAAEATQRLRRLLRGISSWRVGRRTLIASPGSPWRLCWDLLGGALICYDVVFLPLQAFDLGNNEFLTALSFFITVFWTADIPASFMVGFYDQGNLVMNPPSIAKHYMRTWFVIDITVVGGDWVTKFGAEAFSSWGIGRYTRIVRVVRILRLLRLFKLKRIMQELQELVYTEHAFIMMSVLKQLVVIMVMNHAVACAWYWLGDVQGSPSWHDAHFVEPPTVQYAYTTALHWALTQMMPGSMEVNPVTAPERGFAIVVLLLGMIGFSSFVSNITTSMTSLRNLTSEDSKQLWLLRQFVKQQGLPKGLGIRITSFLEYQCLEKKNRVQANDLRILGSLSEPLRDELTYQMRAKHVVSHPLFGMLCGDMQVLMHRLCRTAMQALSLASKDVQFYCGDEAHYVYFFIAGDLIYEHQPLADDVAPARAIDPGDYICEAALWTVWRHVGELRAGSTDQSACELLSLDAGEFGRIVGRNPNAWALASTYGGLFVAELNACSDGEDGEKDVSDIFVLSDGLGRMTCTFPGIEPSAQNSAAEEPSGPGAASTWRRVGSGLRAELTAPTTGPSRGLPVDRARARPPNTL